METKEREMEAPNLRFLACMTCDLHTIGFALGQYLAAGKAVVLIANPADEPGQYLANFCELVPPLVASLPELEAPARCN